MTFDPKSVQDMATAYTRAWCSGDPDSVASFYAPNASIVINRGDPHQDRAGVSAMAAAFHADFPDLVVICDECRVAGDHAVYAWTLEGHHAETGNFVRVGGWEEWDLAEGPLIGASRGWFDGADYDRQVAGG